MTRPLTQARLVEIWSWLPAFRAVAEVEHVQRAAKNLRITPSSLSRAIGLLETHLGCLVFDRVGRNVKLNPAGEELLAAVRDGMRRIDDGIARATGTLATGELVIASEGDALLAFASRAALRLWKENPALTTRIEEMTRKSENVPRLLRGELDAVVVTAPPAHPKVLVEHVGDLAYGIYCGVEHPLAKVTRPTLAAIRAHPFVAPTATPDEGATDQWLPSAPRVVALRVPALAVAIAACATGALVAVLPDLLVAESGDRARLVRLPSESIASSPIYVVRRPPIGTAERAGTFVDALRAEIAQTRHVTARRGRRRPPAGR